MKTRGVVGRTIVEVRQRRLYEPERGWYTAVDAIVLDSGAVLVPVARETEGSPVVDVLVVRKGVEK